ncbi:NAD(P)-bd-dom domain-containing protein [Aphelenchoides besseyi]|nr:NAD(P)-bd-dom domain-containing protein [Aphelenchoides besseyi]
MRNVLLIGGCSKFGLVLAKKLHSLGAHVHIYDNQKCELDGVEFVLGTPDNSFLIRRVVQECKITQIFLLPNPTEDEDAASVARKLLLSTTAVIDEVRQIHVESSSLPQVVHIGQFDSSPEVFSTYKTAILSVEAFLHSYAVSYRMDVRLIRFNDKTRVREFDRLARRVLEISSETMKTPACIYNLESSIEDENENLSIMDTVELNIHLLVYGGKSRLGSELLAFLKKQGILFDEAKLNPELVTPVELQNEISEHSHVIFVGGQADGSGIKKVVFAIDVNHSDRPDVDYAKNGAQNLKRNVCDNCFSPYYLAYICQKMGVHFTYLGMYKKDDENKKSKENQMPTEMGDNYSAVKGFTDQLILQCTKTLNARIPFHYFNERQYIDLKEKSDFNQLFKDLLDMILSQHVGLVDL